MKLFSFLWAFKPPRVPKHTAEDKKRLEKKAIMLASKGNILFQQGRYITKQDIIAAKKRLASPV